MEFYDEVTRVIALLQRDGRLTYRGLQRAFGFDAALLDDLRRELLFRRLAYDERGEGLVWIGPVALTGRPPGVLTSPSATPISATSPSNISLPPLKLARGVTPVSFPEAPPDQLTADLQTDPSASQPEPALLHQTLTGPVSAHLMPEAERRQLTVMFCDFVDASDQLEPFDLEDLRDIMRSHQEAAAAVIQYYEGHIAQVLDRGLLVYFGYPLAHEDDALRAVHTALGMVKANTALHHPFELESKPRYAVRIGIHTGPVVVGEMGGGSWHEQLALGETPNIAARLQDIAASNTVVISDATARLVETVFVCEALGRQAIKGITEPIEVWRVHGLRELESIEDAPLSRYALPLIGRDEEIGLLRRRWEQSREGLGQVVLLVGEAGIGKTSLVNVLREHVAREGFPRVTLRCSPYHQHSALYPVIEQMQRALQINRDDVPEDKRAKLEQGLQTYRFASPEVVPLLARLLSVALPESDAADLADTPQQQRQKTLDALIAWHLEETERQQMLVVWEDLHWADPTTLDFLGLLIDQAPTVPSLNVFTFRPEFIPPWPMRSHMTPLTLNRLERPQVENMLAQLARGKRLPTEVVRHIVTKTDGVPLYVEELTKMLLESDILQEEADRYRLSGALSETTIPATLHDSLMARLDRLSTGREVAQLGAVLGREYTYEMLEALATLTTMGTDFLQAGLAKLVDTELLYQRGRPPRAKYVFKHALVRDAAYQSLLRRTRQHYHEHVAQLLVTRFPDLVETEPEVVAYHYTEAGCTEPAMTFWLQAGHRAIQRSANLEAIGHLARGLEVLDAAADSSAYIEQELQFHTTLGPAFMAAKGYAAVEVERSYVRARDLCEQLGEPPQLFQVMLGLWNVYLVRAELKGARDLAEQCLSLSQSLQDQTRRQQAHYALGNTLFHTGEFTAAREHLGHGIDLYNPQSQHARAVQNPGVVCLAYMAWTLWFLGYPDQAVQRNQEALALARDLSHPYSLAFALDFSAWLYWFRRETAAAHQDVQAAITLSKEQAFPLWLAMGTPLLGWTLVEQGQRESGFAQLREGMNAFRATGAEVFWPTILAMLAESHATSTQAAAGLSVLEEALFMVRQNGERTYEAELHRLKGTFHLQQPVLHPQQAETCFHQALSVARQQQAKSLELRAAVNLSRLWQQQGKCDEARELLTPIYDWFTEGFDTIDLQEANALRDELGG